MNPTISVLMPVWNRSEFLQQALDSVLAQTFEDWELLILDDGSTEDMSGVMRATRDPRIRWMSGPHLGVAGTLNRGLDFATGQFIARMDSDDVCRPDRFAEQIRFMHEHPDIDLCGSFVDIIGKDRSGQWTYPLHHDEIQAGLLFQNCLAHPSVLFRKSSFNRHGLYYDSTYVPAEDHEIWDRSSWLLKFAVIPDTLLSYRLHATQSSALSAAAQRQSVSALHARQLTRLGVKYTKDELDMHCSLVRSPSSAARTNWLEMLLEQNERVGLYSRTAFRAVIERILAGKPV